MLMWPMYYLSTRRLIYSFWIEFHHSRVVLHYRCCISNCICDIRPLLFSLFSGEALLVTSGLVIYFGDMFACTLVKVSCWTSPVNASCSWVLDVECTIKANAVSGQIYEYLVSSEFDSIHSGIKRDEISTIIQVLLQVYNSTWYKCRLTSCSNWRTRSITVDFDL